MNVPPELMQQCTDGGVNMNLQPREEDVQTLREFTGVERAQALVLLKKWPNVEEAAGHYFTDSSAALREAYSERQWQYQDNIPYADDVGPGMALSRPPSPNQQQPENFIDLSAEHAEAGRQTRAQLEPDDDDLQRAMALSLQDSQPQESGVTSAGQRFGRATREHYPDHEWAVTVAPVASSREVFDHPPPAKRRRVQEQPAFLRGSPETGYLGALLTIYHSIPLAREALLFPPLDVYDYGHSHDWWSGSSDENNKALSFQYTIDGNQDRRKYLAEIQCLMAFLDDTNRAYGSVDALADLRLYRKFPSDTAFTRFLESWINAAMSESTDEPLTQVFTTVAARATDELGNAAVRKSLVCVEPPWKGISALDGLFGHMVWNDSVDSIDNVWLDEMGHVFTIRLSDDENSSTKLNLEVPEVWYADRYMSDLRDASMHMRKQRANLQRLVFRLNRAQQRLSEMPVSGKQRLNVRKVLETAHESIPLAYSTEPSKEPDLGPPVPEAESVQLQTDLTELLKQVELQMTRLDQHKKEVVNQITKVMADLIDPATSSQPLSHRYLLYGVSTKPNIVYVRKPNHDLIGQDSDSEDSGDGTWQWWRMAWGEINDESTAPNGDNIAPDDSSPPFSVKKISLANVLQAVKHESSSAGTVLVYASDIASQFAPSALPTALRQFVAQDNQSFEDEISTDGMQSTSRTRSWSEGSTDTINGDLVNDENGPHAIREMTPMSTSTIRDWDGQPSPKRPRSSEDSSHSSLSSEMPPSYETIVGQDPQEMQPAKPISKIGVFADQIMEKYVEDNADERPPTHDSNT